MAKEPVELLVGGEKLDKEASVDGEGNYQIVNPFRLYHGKSYSDWTTDWFNWFLSANADKRNSGPVVFLRSHGLPNSITGAYISDVPGQVTATGTDALPDSGSVNTEEYQAIYVNDPNIRVGSDRLQILNDQAVFVPIITAYGIGSAAYKDWGRMQDFTGLTIDYGDNPPSESQLTINNCPLVLGGLEMEQFRIITPIFMAVVPDAPYGTSVKDFLEDAPIPAGSYPALVEGYFVMLKFDKGSYWVHSWASAPRERSGPYFSELLYEIEVRERRDSRAHRGPITKRPSENERVFCRTLYEKKEIGELTEPEIKRFLKFFSSVSP
jgi:hypothetical protein